MAWWPGGLVAWWPGGLVAWWPGGLVGNNIATCVVNVSLQPCKNLPRCSFA